MKEEQKIEFLLQMLRYNLNLTAQTQKDVVIFTDAELKKVKKELFKLLEL